MPLSTPLKVVPEEKPAKPRSRRCWCPAHRCREIMFLADIRQIGSVVDQHIGGELVRHRTIGEHLRREIGRADIARGVVIDRDRPGAARIVDLIGGCERDRAGSGGAVVGAQD